MNIKNENMIILSPFLLIIFGFITAKISFYYLNVWAWVPLALTYWRLIGVVLFKTGSNKKISSWFQKYTKGKIWMLLAIIIGLIPSPILILNYHLFNSKLIIVLWLLFALINPFLRKSIGVGYY